jgi:hypothetical protein
VWRSAFSVCSRQTTIKTISRTVVLSPYNKTLVATALFTATNKPII